MSGATETKGATDTTNPLAELAINAHGGLDRWRQFEKASADFAQGAVLWQVKGQAGWTRPTLRQDCEVNGHRIRHHPRPRE